MERDLRKDSERVVRKAISACLPDEAVRRALEGKEFPGRVVLVSVGKAAWRMADAVWKALNGKISKGVVLTKYGHLSGPSGTWSFMKPDTRWWTRLPWPEQSGS